MEQNKGTRIYFRILREPLTHFLVLGAALFILFASVNETPNRVPDQIIVDATQLQVLGDQFQRTWMRPPTRKELQGLAEDFVKEEVLYREALALGLDQNDLIIRRRMRQKMEFLNSDLAEQQEVSDADLQNYLDTHTDKFSEPERISFQQVYFNTEKDTQTVQEEIEATLQQLTTNPDTIPETLGDTTLLPPALENSSARETSRYFGRALAGVLADAPVNRWSGPYTSAYGQHLVRITKRTPGRLLSLDEVRRDVEREWRREQKDKADERFYQALRSHYSVEIQLPADNAVERAPPQAP